MATTCKLIGKVTLSSAASSIEVTSIPATYDDLLITFSARGDFNTALHYANAEFTVNGSSSTYTNRTLYGDSSNAASAVVTQAGSWPVRITGSSATASTFGSGDIYIPNYAGATNKSASSTAVTESNAGYPGPVIFAWAYLWSTTDAITSIKLATAGGNMVSGTSLQVYGIKKS